MVYFFLAIGFICLIYGGDMMVCGAVRLARKLGVSPLLIGLTLIGFGTSTPELITSLLAVFQKADGIAVGNVVGSNIANILLVLGTAALISPVEVDLNSFRRDSVFLILSSCALVGAILLGRVSFFSGVLLTGALVFYIVYSYISDKKNQKALKEKEDEINETSGENSCATAKGSWLAFGKTVVGIALTLLGAKLLVDNATELARAWGISEAVIGLTLVAVGTSLPELTTSIISAIRKQNDVAFGNVVGSNIYNALFILGVTALFMPVTVPEKMTTDILIMSGVTVSLVGIAFWKKRFSRPVGALFLTAYIAYTTWLFVG